MQYLLVEADYNDGDIDTKITPIIDTEWYPIIRKVCSVINNNRNWGKNEMIEPYNDPKRWVISGHLTQKEVDLFNDMCPSGDQGYGIHTIESVKIIDIIETLI